MLFLGPNEKGLNSQVSRNRFAHEAMADLNLITDYQAGRISAGTLFGLVLGNYRVLNRLGAGGMGVVFRAEHIQMRKQVAIKVLPSNPDGTCHCDDLSPKSGPLLN